MFFYPDLKREPLEVQASWQGKALARHIDYLKSNSPFYQKKLREVRVDGRHPGTLSVLSELPTTSKEALSQENAAFFAQPRENIREYMSTSGTLGTPVMVALTENDLRRLAYNEAQSFQIAGSTNQDTFQLMLTLDRQFMAGIAYYEGVRQLGARVVRTGPGLPAMQWDVLRQMGTTSLVTIPTFLLKMAEWADSQGIDLSESAVVRAICIGESTREENGQLNALGRRIQEKWPIDLLNTYASTEMQTAFTECPSHGGVHAQPDLIIAEILDEEGKPVPEGEYGELTVTPLAVEGTPLLRYRTGDICRSTLLPCSCGLQSMRLSPILGRKQQMIKYKGTTLYPPAIQNLLHQIPLIQEFIIEARTSPWGTDELLIHVHTSWSEEDARKALVPMLRSKLRVVPPLQFQSLEVISALLTADNSRKLQRFRDLRNKKTFPMKNSDSSPQSL